MVVVVGVGGLQIGTGSQNIYKLNFPALKKQ